MLLLLAQNSTGQSDINVLYKKSRSSIFKIKAGVQFWSVYTFDHKIYTDESTLLSNEISGWNTLVRRSRITIINKISDGLELTGGFSADQIGKNDDSAINGGKSNNSKNISLLDLYARWKIKKDNDLAFLTLGLHRPIFGRETITSSLQSSSFEKSVSQYYQRKHITGIGNGRLVGLALGGKYKLNDHKLFINYNLGIYSSPSNISNTIDVNVSSLITGRLSVEFGDPESLSYTTSLKSNYFGARHGLTIGSSFSRQKNTFSTQNNNSLGLDALFNWGRLNIDGEVFLLTSRHNSDLDKKLTSYGGYIRSSLIFPLTKRKFLEPVIMCTFFHGKSLFDDLTIALSSNIFTGSHEILEGGLNFYYSSKIKFSFFYTLDHTDVNTTLTYGGYNFHSFDSQNRHISRGNQIGIGLTINI